MIFLNRHPSLDALGSNDPVRAREVVNRDGFVDACYAQCFPELMSVMIMQPERIDAAIRLQSIAKAFERIGDQAVNVAEMVVFVVEGADIRHVPVERPVNADMAPVIQLRPKA
jgi:phosphate transport system protein